MGSQVESSNQESSACLLQDFKLKRKNRKQNDVSSVKSSRVRAKAAPTVIRKQKSSSPFYRTPKVSASSKVKVKSSQLKISQKSKSIKKVAAKKIVKKSNDNKTKKIVALKTKIDLMNKKIKLAEKIEPAS